MGLYKCHYYYYKAVSLWLGQSSWPFRSQFHPEGCVLHSLVLFTRFLSLLLSPSWVGGWCFEIFLKDDCNAKYWNINAIYKTVTTLFSTFWRIYFPLTVSSDDWVVNNNNNNNRYNNAPLLEEAIQRRGLTKPKGCKFYTDLWVAICHRNVIQFVNVWQFWHY